jgi:hypothetical protein
MKYHLFCLALFAAACGAPPPAATPAGETAGEAVQTEDGEDADMIALIDRFLADPNVKDAKPIMDFMTNSPKVMVVIDQRLDVGHDSALNDDAKALLSAGFVAGNVRAQLESGVKENAPVDGVRGMLRVYAALKSKDEGLRAAAVDTLAEKEAAGTLEEHVKALLAPK